MPYRSKVAAQNAAVNWLKTMPAGWTADVYENVGWRLKLLKGPATVYESDGGFFCIIRPPDGDDLGFPWFKRVFAKTPADAVAAEVASVRDHVARQHAMLAELLRLAEEVST